MSRVKSRSPTIVLAAGPHADGAYSAAVRQPFRVERRAHELGCRRARSQSLQNLQKQMEALSELNRRKDEFLAMLSHELRNPLGAIRNAVHALGLLQNEDSLHERARTIIKRQVEQMTRLVDDLMEVSRIGTGKLRLRQEHVVMSGIVERALEMVRPLMTQRKHELEVSLSPQPIWLCADAARLEQVIVNLLVNAAKYTGDGGHLRLNLEREGDECVLRLRDTGVGIAPELLPRVFDLFMQEERSLRQSCGGMGIGLALVKQLVELHHGTVVVDSALGQGTEFVVRLPAALPPVPQLHLTSDKTPALPSRDSVVDGNRRTSPSVTMPARV